MKKYPLIRLAGALVALLVASLSSLAATDCTAPAKPLDVRSSNWGLGNDNHRYQPNAVITGANAAQLQLRWVFALGDGQDSSPHSYPVVTADTIYIASENGIVHALDRNSGCERWRFNADNNIRTAMGIYSLKNAHNDKVRRVLVFGGVDAWLYAIDAHDGELIWRRQVDDQRFVMITGTPTYVDGKLIVGLSSYEAMVAAVPFYPCCRFRGAVLAIDARSGDELWRRKLIAKRARPISDNGLWTTAWGPSGVPVWSRPAVDARQRRVYVGTGENYSGLQSTTLSDAIVALDLDNGRIVWSRQFLEGDVWNLSCDIPLLGFNCRNEKAGPDLDFGAAPIRARLKTLGDVIFAGQKSGQVYAIDADDGSVIWERQLGRGGKLGGIHWGMAYHPFEKTLYVPVNDQGSLFLANPPGDGRPGLYALDAVTGEVRWQYEDGKACSARDCAHGFSAAITVSPEIVAAGKLDGELLLFNRKSGELLWRFDTNKSWPAVNAAATGGEQAQGGAIDVHGPLLVDDLLIVQSGYAAMGDAGGNALMVFGLPPEAIPAAPVVEKPAMKVPASPAAAEQAPGPDASAPATTPVQPKPATDAQPQSQPAPEPQPQRPAQPVSPSQEPAPSPAQPQVDSSAPAVPAVQPPSPPPADAPAAAAPASP